MRHRAAAPPERKAWQELPELYRRMVVAAAGLPRELVETKDRELSERDKVMMRSAISDMRTWLESVGAL
jgi:pyrroloquinoline quinone (PQQ) biosynthesis protein C